MLGGLRERLESLASAPRPGDDPANANGAELGREPWSMRKLVHLPRRDAMDQATVDWLMAAAT